MRTLPTGVAPLRRPITRAPRTGPHSDAAGPLAARSGRTLTDIFERSAERWPNAIALDAPDARLTYTQLRDRAIALAAGLESLGLGPGDNVAVRVRSGTAQLYVAVLGVLVAGCAYVPIDVDDPPERADDIAVRSGARVVIADGLTIEPLVSLDERQAEQRSRAGEPATPADDAWVIFTSGSTGRPKAVAVTHRSAAAFVDAEAGLWTVAPGDRVLAGLSVGFDASCEEIWLAWRNGAALVPAPRETVRAGEELGRWLIDQRITVVSTVPTLAAMWDESCLHGVRLLILGGEACPEALGWRLAAGREVWNTYGPTEATVVSTAAPIIAGRPITIGRPLSGWEVAVVDDGEPVGPGEPGELVIAGVGLARYLDLTLDTERYAPMPALGWDRAYRTGDVVREGPDGLEFVGRRDDQVKIGGRRIELGEIEAALTTQSDVRAAAVAVRESAAGNRLLVGYVVPSDEQATGSGDAAALRARVARRLPAGLVPLVVFMDALPCSSSGKIDRRALPWPVGGDADALAAGIGADGEMISEFEVWVGEHWVQQLGPVPITPDSDFFALGGTSLAAAKLISVIRRRHPSVAVADLYEYPTLRTFAARLAQIGEADDRASVARPRPRRAWGVLQLLSVLALLCVTAPAWVLGVAVVDRVDGSGPQLSWIAIVIAAVVIASPLSRALVVIGCRRLFLAGLTPGRYPRRGVVATKIITVERLAALAHFEQLAGTPWAARYARFCGHAIGQDVNLATLPSVTSLVTIGEGATIEAEVDLQGWWLDDEDLVIDRIEIGSGARIGTRSLLMPGAVVGAGAEVEPGTVVDGTIATGERWSGVEARQVGVAGDHWPAQSPSAQAPRQRRFWKTMFWVGMTATTLLPLLASLPAIALFFAVRPTGSSTATLVREVIFLAPALALLFTLSYALLGAVCMRALAPLIRTGYQPNYGATGWALWMHGRIVAQVNAAVFPVYASSFTRRWLRLCGIPVGRRTEVSITGSLNRHTSLGEGSFAADDVIFSVARSRNGWLHVGPIAVGSRTFLGNSALLGGGTQIGDDSLIGLMTNAPSDPPHGTSWLGAPALELPRRPTQADPSRTTSPPRRLRIARRAMDTVRILLPPTVASIIGVLMLGTVAATGTGFGLLAMLAVTPIVLLGGGVVATLVTIAIKWLLMGRYRPGDHPLHSFYVWRDEIVNSCQEQLAGPMLLGIALGTPLMSLYLRLMGARVGRDVWVDNLNTTEFDLVEIGDGCAVNRAAVLETHLFHDRVMSTGPSRLGAGVTLAPACVVLPDTVVNDRASVGGRSIVLRGEELPADSRWHGAPVRAV